MAGCESEICRKVLITLNRSDKPRAIIVKNGFIFWTDWATNYKARIERANQEQCFIIFKIFQTVNNQIWFRGCDPHPGIRNGDFYFELDEKFTKWGYLGNRGFFKRWGLSSPAIIIPVKFSEIRLIPEDFSKSLLCVSRIFVGWNIAKNDNSD